jgi:hypothetical protein
MYNLDEEIEASFEGEWIVENLCLGDNVAISTTTDEPFWLMLDDKGAHVVVTSFKMLMATNGQEGTLLCEDSNTNNYNQGVVLTLFVMINLSPLYFPT